MSLRKDIISLLGEDKKEMTIQEIYAKFPNVAKTTIRGRIYDALGKDIHRLAKGLYISSQCIIEQGNSLEIVDRMLKDEDKFDFIFLDIPYEAGGNIGGNRDLFACDKISPEQFGSFISKCEQLLKTDTSPLLFMFTSGKSSKVHHDRYFNKILETNLKRCSRTGTYQKLWSNGNPMNMGKYEMPKENLYIFTKSGQCENIENWQLDFALTPNLRLYPTAKPYSMIKTLIEQATKIGDWVFDPFAGSGATLKSCIDLLRKCHTVDSSTVSVEEHLLKLV